MSPRAACRLATLGFESVYHYVAGKVDWLARGLPREGERAAETRAADLVRTDVPTFGLEEPAARARELIDGSPHGFGFVVSDGGILLGRLRRSMLDGDLDGTAASVMEPGPSTTRADATVEAMTAKLQGTDLTSLVITDPEGVLLGVVRRRDLEA